MKPNRVTAVIERFKQSASIIGAEVGVWKGAFSDAILEAMPNLKLIMVDRWCVTPVGDSYFDGSIKISRMGKNAFEEACQITVNKVAKYPGRYEIIRNDSALAARRFADEYFDFVFIDADHSYPGVTRDIEAWFPKVKIGGWLCGHDYDHPEQGEVKRAVHEFFERKEIPLSDLLLAYNRTWFYKKTKA